MESVSHIAGREVCLVSNNTTSDLSSITDTHRSFCSSSSNDGAGGWNKYSESRAHQNIVYGRSRETLQLLKTYQKLLQTKQSQTVLVHGESGCGKTSLVDFVREQVCASNGYFVTGKYIQNSTTREPYSAIMAAFSDICDLTAQSEDCNEQRCKQIQEGLGSDAQLLIKAITNLSPFIGESSSRDFVDTVQPSFARFKTACKTFLRVMASEKHPLVIFIDDIQWADEASQLLMEALLVRDAKLKNVMFVLAYRDDEPANLVRILQCIQHPVDIVLVGLDECAIHQILTSILNSCTDELRGLSKLVARRACGNPFHAMMLLESLIQGDLLTFDAASEKWLFQLDTIQEEIMVSDSLADLLTRKIARLPPLVKETLKVASLIGYQFDRLILVDVVCTKIDERLYDNGLQYELPESAACQRVMLSVSAALKGGFIETLDDGYHFTHDKLQAAFQGLINKREAERLHELIGEAYLAKAAKNTDDNSDKYNAAVHLNCAPDYICNSSVRQAKLARINLDAAKHCDLKSAFVNSVTMLRKGLAVLGIEDRWSEENFHLTFEIMERLARAELIIGDFEACKQTTKESLSRGKTVDMKIKLLMIDVEVRAAVLEAKDGFLPACRALATLGVNLPHAISLRRVLIKFLKLRMLLRHKLDDYLLRLPVIDNEATTAAIKLLMHVCACGLATNNKGTAIFAALLAIELTLKHGLSPQSPFAFAIYGVVELSIGNIERAHRFGKIALTTLDRVNSQEAACSTVGFASTLLLCGKELIKELIDPLHQVGSIGFRNGDIIFGSYCLAQSYSMQSILGANLKTLESAMRQTYTMISETGQESLLLWHQPYLQHTINMRSEMHTWEITSTFRRGEIMDEHNFFPKVEEANSSVLKLIALRIKAQEAVFFGQYATAVSIYEKIESAERSGLDRSHRVPSSYWLAVQAYSALYVSTGQRCMQRKARKYTKKLERMDAHGCLNVSPYLSFLHAEQVSRQKTIDESALHLTYCHALSQLRESAYVHLEGLLCEKAGFEFARRGQVSNSEWYFRRALDVYLNKWGSIAKYSWLREQSEELVQGLDRSSTNDEVLTLF